jgi:hypothetical protein
MRSSLMSAGLLVISCASLGPQSPLPGTSLAIDVDVEESEVAGRWHSVATIRIRNLSRTSVAVSNTFGITNRPWISLEIEHASGARIPYPSEVDVFGEIPTYKCLDRGGVIEVRIDLMEWRATFGGEPSDEIYAFRLAPGKYRVRALYSDRPERVRARCPGINGTAVSEWHEFEIPERAGEDG